MGGASIKSHMLVLGIETSCDETAASVVEDGRQVLSNVISSSENLHKKFGGIVPEIAFRHHVEKINTVIDIAIEKAGFDIKNIDLICVTRGPGLIGSLLVGVTAAKSISFVLNKPVSGINHIQSHLFSSLLDKDKHPFPAIGLIISGGHTSLVYIKDYLNFKLLGETLDDAAGEAFDKVARILKLGYPGGPEVERLARQGDDKSIIFPVGLKRGLNFSFSGLKTAVLYYIRDNLSWCLENNVSSKSKLRQRQIADICASFQSAAIDTLIYKTKKALEHFPDVKFLFTGGGVVANTRLRERLLFLEKSYNIKVLFPEKSYCTDNAAMVAGLGFWQYRMLDKKGINKLFNLDFQADPSLTLENI